MTNRGGRRRGQRGASLIEAALITPIFFFILFGIIEMALLVNANLTLASTTADASRAATVFGRNAAADFNILSEVQERVGDARNTTLERVVVFHASGPGDSVPALCRTGASQTTSPANGVGACNVYTSAHFGDGDVNHFDCIAPTPSYSSAWCPTARKVAAQAPNGPPDYLGVYVRVRHAFVSGWFGTSVTLERTSVVRLEPQSLNG